MGIFFSVDNLYIDDFISINLMLGNERYMPFVL